jgi:hypothetical protein
MRNIYFGDFRAMVVEYIKQIDNTHPDLQSTEWFLLRYLRHIVKVTEPPAEAGKVEGAVRSLVRFYVDNINEKTELGRICLNIYDEYRKVLREKQKQDALHSG